MKAYFRNDKGEFIEFTKQVLADLLSKDVDDIFDDEFEANIFYNNTVAYYRDMENVVRPFEYDEWHRHMLSIEPSDDAEIWVWKAWHDHYEGVREDALSANLDLRSKLMNDTLECWKEGLRQESEKAWLAVENAQKEAERVEYEYHRTDGFLNGSQW